MRALASVLALCAASPALADDEPRPEKRRSPEVVQEPTAAFRFDFGFTSTSPASFVRILVYVPDLHLRVRLTDRLHAEADWGFAVSTIDNDAVMSSESTTRVGNPSAGVYLDVSDDGPYRMQLGLVGTVPVARVDEDDAVRGGSQAVTLAIASHMGGVWDTWRWTSNAGAVSIPVRVDYGLTSGLSLGLDSDVAVLIPTEDRSVDAFVQTALDVRYRQPTWALGLRTQLVILATAEVDDKVRASLLPYADYHIGQATLGMRLLLNLDAPLGFAFEQGGVWGLWLGVGYAI